MLGDITKVPAGAIVNAANSGLSGGGGVDGAIHQAGGPEIMRELDKVRARITRCEPGNAVVTGAGNLPAEYVLHAVGPIYRSGDAQQASVLASCYRNCLELAQNLDIQAVSFPSISTGPNGYPLEEAAPIAVRTVGDYVIAEESLIETAIFVLFDAATLKAYEDALESWRRERLE